MALFNNSVVYSSLSENNTEVTDDMLFEAFRKCSDTLSEIATESVTASILCENGMAEILTEGFAETKKKVVDGLKRLWETIKGWFQNIIAKLKVLFTGQKKFIAKYENDIMAKVSRLKSSNSPMMSKSIKFYNYRTFKGNFSKFANAINKAAAHLIVDAAKNDNSDGTGNSEVSISKSDITAKLVKEGASALGAGSMESLPELKKALYNKFVTVEENHTLTDQDIKNLIVTLKSVDKVSEEVKGLFNYTYQTFTTGINNVAKAEHVGSVTVTSNTASAGMAVIQSIASECSSLATSSGTYAYKVLKSFLSSGKNNSED